MKTKILSSICDKYIGLLIQLNYSKNFKIFYYDIVAIFWLFHHEKIISSMLFLELFHSCRFVVLLVVQFIVPKISEMFYTWYM